jgi:diketogulonate reductase-like aldo/keto reductase
MSTLRNVRSPLPSPPLESPRRTDYNNESSVGTALRETGLARSEFFITSKYSSGDVQEEVRNSLEKVRNADLFPYASSMLFLWKAGTQTTRPIPHSLARPHKGYCKDMEGI